MFFLNLSISFIIFCTFYYSEEFLINSMSFFVFFILFYFCFFVVPSIFAEAGLKLKFYFILLCKMLKKVNKAFLKYYFSVMSFVIIPIVTSIINYIQFFIKNFLIRLLNLYNGAIFRYIISTIFFFVHLHCTNINHLLFLLCDRIRLDLENFYILPNTSFISKSNNFIQNNINSDDIDLSDDLFIDLNSFIDKRLITNSALLRCLEHTNFDLFFNSNLLNTTFEKKTSIIFSSEYFFSKNIENRKQVLSHFFFFSYFASENFLLSDFFQKFNN